MLPVNKRAYIGKIARYKNSGQTRKAFTVGEKKIENQIRLSDERFLFYYYSNNLGFKMSPVEERTFYFSF